MTNRDLEKLRNKGILTFDVTREEIEDYRIDVFTNIKLKLTPEEIKLKTWIGAEKERLQEALVLFNKEHTSKTLLLSLNTVTTPKQARALVLVVAKRIGYTVTGPNSFACYNLSGRMSETQAVCIVAQLMVSEKVAT